MTDLIRNIRTGTRLLLRRPGFGVALLLTLGIGIGATTAVFGVVRAVLLRPLPFTDPSRLVMIWSTMPERGADRMAVSDDDYVAFRDRSRAFSGVAAVASGSLRVERDGLTEEVSVALASANLLDVLGVQPLLGRGFTADETGPVTSDVVMIGESEWRSRFGGDPAVLGRTVRLDDRPHTIVGVLRADFTVPRVGGMRQVGYWAPLGRVGGRGLGVIARLADGATYERAEADVQRIATARVTEDAAANEGIGAHVVSLHEQAVGNTRPAMRMLGGVVLLVLLVACANAANLLFGQGTRREREIAVRAALGGGRSRIVRQMLHENLVIAALGGGLGVLVSIWVTDALIGLVPGELPRIDQAQVDATVLLFAAATTLTAVFVAGLLPALRASRTDPMTGLLPGRHASPRGVRGRAIASAVQVTLAVMLLASALLLSRSLAGLSRVDLGFDPDGVVAIEASLGREYATDEGRPAFAEEVARSVGRIPGVQSAAVVSPLPVSGITMRGPVVVPGRADTLLTVLRAASPAWFETMSIPILRGRAFDDGDRPGTEPVAIINETMESLLFNGPAVGQRLDLGTASGTRTVTVVGVVPDARVLGPAEPPGAELYTAWSQYSALLVATVVVKTNGPLDGGEVRRRIASAVPGRPVDALVSFEDLLAGTIADTRFYTFLVGLFAVTGLALAAIGVFGVIQQTVLQRNFEIGVRLALGAEPSLVMRSVLRQGTMLATGGALVGVAGAIVTNRLLEGLLFGVRPADPAILALAAVLAVATAGLATWLPARRAAAVDPVVALRG